MRQRHIRSPATCISTGSPSKMGIDRMHEFMSAFGYGELTGIDIPGEKPGLVRVAGMEAAGIQAQGRSGVVSRRDHQHGHRPRSDHGHAAAAGALSRPKLPSAGQIIAVPRLVAATRAPGSVTVVPRSPSASRNRSTSPPMSNGTWSYDGMVGAVTSRRAARRYAGRARRQVQTGRQDRHRSGSDGQANRKHASTRMLDERKREHAWFIAFAPVDDPKIAISVLIENGGFGGLDRRSHCAQGARHILTGRRGARSRRKLRELGSATNSH